MAINAITINVIVPTESKMHNHLKHSPQTFIVVFVPTESNVDTALSGRGGPGRNQGRKRLAAEGDEAVYKLRMSLDQRTKLDKLGGAGWMRRQIDTASAVANYSERNSMNTSSRYIRALRQLPQFIANADPHAVLTHVLTGVRVLPIGLVEDPGDETELLQLVFPGGHTVEVVASAYLKLQIAEGARHEVETKPDEVGVPDRKLDIVQKRTREMEEHLLRKHGLPY